MSNGAPLREWKDRGRKVVYFGWLALFIETILILALGSLYGIVGLGAGVVIFNVTLLIIVLSLQDQINANDGALRGTRDESTYSDEVESHLRRRLGQSEGAVRPGIGGERGLRQRIRRGWSTGLTRRCSYSATDSSQLRIVGNPERGTSRGPSSVCHRPRRGDLPLSRF